MSLYPSLEDFQVDKLAKTQDQVARVQHALTSSLGGEPSLYASLGLEDLMATYGGLDISTQALERYMPHDLALQVASNPYQQAQPLASITKPNDANLVRAQVRQGVREVILAKDAAGKLGFAVTAIDKGIFISFVWNNSSAALGGLRFGDQIIQIDGQSVAGWTGYKTLCALKEAKPERVSIIVRDRPFDRTVTVVKDSHNQIGFMFKAGEITAIVKESSAARNGLLINHHIVEVNGQNVVGLKDKDAIKIMHEAPVSLTLTVMPTFVYDHLVKNIGLDKIAKFMDHSIPDV